MREDPRSVIGRTLSGDVLEIGPGHVPFPTAPDARVRYADRSVEGGRDKNFPELIGLPHGPEPDWKIDLDVDGLPIPDSSLDVVIACHVIEHLANPIAALREFERALRPQGRLVLVVPDRNSTFDYPRQSTPLAHVLAKFHQGVTQVKDEEIREFCSAIYYQLPIHPTVVREWHNPRSLSPDLLELHRRRTIHVHCWSPEEFASLIAGLLAYGLASWKFADLYLPGDPRQIEFGLVLERGALTSRAGSNQFVRDWTSAVLGTPDHDPRRIAMFDCVLHRDLTLNDWLDATAALADVAVPIFSKMEGLKIGQSVHESEQPNPQSNFYTTAISNLHRLMSAIKWGW
jgi:SAM-dependent methyltransferase